MSNPIVTRALFAVCDAAFDSGDSNAIIQVSKHGKPYATVVVIRAKDAVESPEEESYSDLDIMPDPSEVGGKIIDARQAHTDS